MLALPLSLYLWMNNLTSQCLCLLTCKIRTLALRVKDAGEYWKITTEPLPLTKQTSPLPGKVVHLNLGSTLEERPRLLYGGRDAFLECSIATEAIRRVGDVIGDHSSSCHRTSLTLMSSLQGLKTSSLHHVVKVTFPDLVFLSIEYNWCSMSSMGLHPSFSCMESFCWQKASILQVQWRSCIVNLKQVPVANASVEWLVQISVWHTTRATPLGIDLVKAMR